MLYASGFSKEVMYGIIVMVAFHRNMGHPVPEAR